MQLSTKKIIAREGLVVVLILFISLVLFGTSQWFDQKSEELQDFGKIYLLTDPITKIEFQVPAKSEEQLTERVHELEKIENQSVLPEYTKQKFGGEINAITKRKYYQERESKFELWSFWFFILAYPAYLVFRFIFWAVITLKQNT